VNPLHFQITTAGDDLVSPCGDQHQYACQILDGVLEDDPSTLSFFAFIAHADPRTIRGPRATWQKANPHWGISVEPEDMRKLAAKAMKMPSAAAEFKQKRLNLWVNATAPCLSVEGWRKGQSALDREEFEASLEGDPCWAAVDLASKIDLCALSLLFPPTEKREMGVIQRLWTPADTLDERAHRDRAPYDLSGRTSTSRGWLRNGRSPRPAAARRRTGDPPDPGVAHRGRGR
jgi:phage terminase large subunit-like protein